MRFTPTASCQVTKAKVFSYIGGGSASQCKLYVWDNQSGKPGTQRYQTNYMPIHNSWQEIAINPPLTYNTDFWIGIQIPSETTSSDVWIVSDSGVNYSTRNATKKTPSSSWEVPSSKLRGDLCIRAIVSYTGVEEELSPSEPVSLGRNYPNPFLNRTTISYTVPQEVKVELKIYDATGKVVRTLVEAVQTPGQKSVVWDSKDSHGNPIPGGAYFYQLKVDGKLTRKLMIHIK